MNVDWTKIDIQHCIRYLLASTSARVFVGQPACRNPQWLKTSVKYSEDLMMTTFILRVFPKWAYHVAIYCIPFRWRMMYHYKVGREIVRELLEARTAAEKNGEEPQDTLLNWMMDKGTKQETEIHEMGARQCFLTMASIHTTSLGTSSALFRLCSHPEWIPVLREEVEQVIGTHGWLQEGNEISPLQWTSKLEKMDSFIVETQRLDPVGLSKYYPLTVLSVTRGMY